MPKKMQRAKKQKRRAYDKPISLYGVPLDEAIGDILKSPPMAKKEEKKRKQ